MAKKGSDKKISRRGAASRQRTPPNVVAVLVCDALSDDPGTGKTTVYGVFDRFIFRDVTKPSRPIFCWAKLQGGDGDFEIGLAIRYKDGILSPIESPRPTVKCTAETSFETGAIFVVQYATEGYCEIVVTANGKPIGSPYRLFLVDFQQLVKQQQLKQK